MPKNSMREHRCSVHRMSLLQTFKNLNKQDKCRTEQTDRGLAVLYQEQTEQTARGLAVSKGHATTIVKI